MKDKAIISYEQLIDCIEKFSEDYVKDLNEAHRLQIKGYTLELALYLSEIFFFDGNKESVSCSNDIVVINDDGYLTNHYIKKEE